jgi:protein subunit release factor A
MIDDAVTRRLDVMAQQFRELEAQLSDPAVVSDHQKVAELSRQRASIEPLVRR